MTQPVLASFLLDPLRGRTRLWKVAWLYGFGGSVLYGAIATPFMSGSEATTRFWTLAGVVLGVYQSAALWQCAYNGRSRFVGHLVRAAVVVSLLLVPLFAYWAIANPELLSI